MGTHAVGDFFERTHSLGSKTVIDELNELFGIVGGIVVHLITNILDTNVFDLVVKAKTLSRVKTWWFDRAHIAQVHDEQNFRVQRLFHRPNRMKGRFARNHPDDPFVRFAACWTFLPTKTGALMCCEPDPMPPCVVQCQRYASPTSPNKTQFWFVAKFGPVFAMPLILKHSHLRLIG